MKGVSPLIASVLLIAITMTLAAILASFVSNYTREQLSSLPSCVGGNIIFSSADYPKWDEDVDAVVAVIEAENVDLEDFSFEILLNNDSVITSNDVIASPIPAGGAGTVKSGVLSVTSSEINTVRITAGNCPGVKTDWTALRT